MVRSAHLQASRSLCILPRYFRETLGQEHSQWGCFSILSWFESVIVWFNLVHPGKDQASNTPFAMVRTWQELYCIVSCHTPKWDLWHSQTTATVLLAVGFTKKQLSQLSAFQHYSKLMILGSGYVLFSSQHAKPKLSPISIYKVLHNSCRFQHRVTVSIAIYYKEHTIEIQYFHLILELSQYL